MKKRTFFAAVLMIFSLSLPFGVGWAENDFQYWSRFQIKALDTKYVDYVTYGELRLNENASNLGFWQSSQKIILDLSKYFAFGINYTYLENESFQRQTRDTEFRHQHRFELEANPSWRWKDKLKIKNRNRFEFRWMEDQGSDHARYRHLWELDIPLEKMGPLTSIYTGNEFFVDFNSEKINENRVTPVGLTFKLHKKSNLKIFYMIQLRKRDSDWSSNHIFGSHVSLAY